MNVFNSLQKDTEIQKSDQEKINMFSRLNMRAHELRNDIKKLKEELDALEDAEMLIEESFGEGLKLFIGECLVDVDETKAQEYQENQMTEIINKFICHIPFIGEFRLQQECAI